MSGMLETLGLRLDADGAIQKIRDFGAAADKTARQTEVLEHGVELLGLAFGSWKAAQFGTEALNLAARYETLGVAMNVVGHNAGFSSHEMAAFDSQLRKTGISMIESRNNLARMAAAQLDLAQSAKLARVAQDAAVLGDINSSEAFERLVQGIVSGQPRILHTMGIFADFGRAEREWANSHDRVFESLSQVEKVNIRLNATLEEGAKRAGVYDAAFLTAGKQLQSTNRFLDDLKVRLGDTFLPEYTVAIFAYANALKFAGDHTGEISVAVELMAAGFAGRALQALNTFNAAQRAQLETTIASRAATLSANEAEVIAANVHLAGAQNRLAANQILGASEAELAALENNVVNAQFRLALSAQSAAAAEVELAAAATWTGRAIAEAGALGAKGMALVGGPIGLAVIAAVALNELLDVYLDHSSAAAMKAAEQTEAQAHATDAALKVAHGRAAAEKKAADALTEHAQKFAALKEEREQELAKQTMLNAAFGQSANALKALDIEYDAAIERAKNAKEHRGAELKTLNDLTDGLARQKIVAAALEADQSRRDSMRDVGIGTDAQVRAAEQERALIGLSTEAISRQRIENDALNASIDARLERDKAVFHADANEIQAAQDIYDNTLYRIAANKDLAESQRKLQIASGTLEIRAHAEALEMETRALANGAVSRKDYQANLDANVAGRRALREIGFGDPIALAVRFAAIEQERREKIALVELKDATTEHDRAVKDATENAKHFATEQQHIARVLEDDLLHAVQSFTTTGLKSFTSFFSEVERLSLHMVGQLDEHLRKLADQKKLAEAAGPDFGNQVQKISTEIAHYEQLRKAAEAAAIVVSAATGGYQIGQQLYSGSHSSGQNTALGALGGAASGAAAGAAFGPWGAAAGAVVGLTAGIIGAGHAAAEAAKQMREMQTAVGLSMAELRATVDHNTLGAGIAQINADREARRKAIEDAYAGGDANSTQVAKRVAALNEMNKLEDTRIKQLEHETIVAAALAARQQQRDQEDLSVRILSAQGYTDASGDAGFRNQQLREYQDAVSAKRSPEYLALLTHAQLDEAIQRATQRDIERQTSAIAEANKIQQATLDAQLKAQQDALRVNQDQLNTAQQNVQALQQVVDTLANFSDSLKLSDLSPLSPIEQLAEAKRQLDADYAKAQGGDVQAGSDFANYAKAFLTASRDVNASGVGYVSDYSTVQQMTDALQGKFGTQLTAEQQIVAQLTAANAALTAQIAAIQSAKDAAQASADAQTAALTTKTDAQTTALLAALEQSRNTALLPADSLLAALGTIASAVDGAARATITAEQAALFESRNAAEAAANAQIDAIRNGGDAATVQMLATIAELQTSRLVANTHAVTVEAQLLKSGALSQDQIDALITNRQAANDASLAAIAAVRDGRDTATQENLKQIAELQQTRLAMNTQALSQEDVLVQQRVLLEQQITEAQGGAQYQQLVAQKAAIDAQIGAIEGARVSAEQQALAQLAALVAIRDKSWSTNIVFTPPATTTNTDYPTGANTGNGYATDENGNRIYAFAQGGLFGGGVRMVGEQGPELEVTGPSRIVSASQTNSLLADALGQSAKMAAELRDLNDSSAATVAVLQAGLSALVARVEALAARVEENTKVTKRGFEGMS